MVIFRRALPQIQQPKFRTYGLRTIPTVHYLSHPSYDFVYALSALTTPNRPPLQALV
jgi:hypothetical protein